MLFPEVRQPISGKTSKMTATYQRGEAVSYEREIAGSGRTLQVYMAPTPEGGHEARDEDAGDA